MGSVRMWLWTFIWLFACAAQISAAEMRGLWVDAFHPGFKSPAETSAMVEKAKECGFNAILVQVRRRGDVYYRSDIEPMAGDVASGYDPLGDLVVRAHKAGLEVHAWISVYEVYHDSEFSPANSRQVHLKHPDWIMKDSQGKSKFPGDKVYLDPGVPDVKLYLVSIIDEICRKYEVDGIHLDIVRYPSVDGGYSAISLARFAQEAGRGGTPEPRDEAWSSWRRTQVTDFVRAAYETVNSGKRKMVLSASVFADKIDARGYRFQDWESWLETGILDFAVPMVFPKDMKVFESVLAGVGSEHGRRIYIGQGGYRLPAATSMAQIRLARKAGYQGVVVYSYAYCSAPRGEDRVSLMDSLRAELFSKWEAVPSMNWKQDD